MTNVQTLTIAICRDETVLGRWVAVTVTTDLTASDRIQWLAGYGATPLDAGADLLKQAAQSANETGFLDD